MLQNTNVFNVWLDHQLQNAYINSNVYCKSQTSPQLSDSIRSWELCCFLGPCVASCLQVRTISYLTSSDLWFHEPLSPCIELIIVLSSQCLPQPADSHISPFFVVFWCLNLVHVITEFGEMKEHILCYTVCFAYSCLASTWPGYSGSCNVTK